MSSMQRQGSIVIVLACLLVATYLLPDLWRRYVARRSGAPVEEVER